MSYTCAVETYLGVSASQVSVGCARARRSRVRVRQLKSAMRKLEINKMKNLCAIIIITNRVYHS